MTSFSYKSALLLSAAVATGALSLPAMAQEQATDGAATAASAPMDSGFDDIIVTATKRADAQNVQSVPFAVTAFGAAQLENQHFTTLQSLSYSMPNVQLGQVGTAPGYANFSIRGLGINSSIPSIDPTVGVFVDGMYLGISAGVVFNNFDVEGLEVLRGPQGLLFGKNVTGGAVVLRTTTPTNDWHVNARASLSSGLEYKASAVVSGPIVKDLLQFKLAVLYDKDEGYFYNRFNGNDRLGQNKTVIVRPALRLAPSSDFEMILRYEHGEYDGDGAVSSNHGLFARDSFDVNIDNEGFSHNRWDNVSLETNIDTSFGDGKITNLMAYRNFDAYIGNDVDASPVSNFNSTSKTRQRQLSDELRYSGKFGRVDITTGLYFFTQQVSYIESRTLSQGATRISGGGRQNQETIGIFGSADWHFTDTLTLNLGARWTTDQKKVSVANLVPGGCNIDTGICNYTFNDNQRWNGLTPRVGLQWRPNDGTQVYAFWAKGLRAGGYNFRNVNAAARPGPFDDETQNSYEVGVKQDFGRLLRMNLSAFWNTIDNVQREIITPILSAGTAQVITNAANARIRGVEGEMTLRPGHGFTLAGQFGYTEGRYTNVLLDLTGDGVINARDYALQLPRLSPWTYGGSISWTHDVGDFTLDARAAANHTDGSWYNDANTGFLVGATMVDANLAISKGPYKLSVYGTNLLNRATFGTEAPLPYFAGSTFSTLNKGRVYGVELSYRF